MKGQNYTPTEADDFESDTGINMNNGVVPHMTNITSSATPALGQFSDQFFYNTRVAPASSDQAYYLDPSQGWNPFWLGQDSDGGRSLHINARSTPYGGKGWESGTLQGKPLEYGYITATEKIEANIQGFHPAGLWLESTTGDVNSPAPPRLVEADIQETFGGTADPNAISPKQNQDHATVHSGYANDENLGGWLTANNDISQNFHTYAMLWTNSYVEFYLDGTPRPLWPGANLQQPASSLGVMVPIMILSVWDGGEQGGLKPLVSSTSIDVRSYAWYQQSSGSCSGGVQ